MTKSIQPLDEPTPLLSISEIQERIERLDVSADAKAILFDLANASVEVAGRVISAGKKILSFVFDLANRFPNTAFGLVVGFVLSTLVGSIPFLGPLLGAVLGPLLVAFGLGAGAIADFKERALIARVQILENEFNEMTPKTA